MNRLPSLLVLLVLLVACRGPDPCVEAGDDALSTCLSPTMSEAHYIEQGHAYFDALDTEDWVEVPPAYSELVARWEWPPWWKLTAFGRANIESGDTLLQLYPSTVPERDCRFFDTQPFARCKVVFRYEDPAHEGRGCPIYEEFTFNDAGEITFIEAWSDLPAYVPWTDPGDLWAEEEATRLSTRIPGLGNAAGLIDLDGDAMADAMARDRDVLDFVERANDWYATWIVEVEIAGDDVWERGCGW